MDGRANVDKWQRYWSASRPSVTLQAYHRQVAERIVGRLGRLFPPAAEETEHPLRLLDAGCGQGNLTVMLAGKTGYETAALDIIAEPLRHCHQLAGERQIDRVSVVRASVFRMPFRDGTFDIAVSTGSESAAAYPGAAEEVIRVVKKGGTLFIDFTAMPNLYQPVRSLKDLFRYLQARRTVARGGKTKRFHYGKLGLKERFERRLGLRIRQTWYMNTAPPWGGVRARLLFEKSAGRWLGPLLARTVLVEMENSKKDECGY